MNLLDFERLWNEHRTEIEERLKHAKAVRKNLDRMAKEAFAEIERRAHEDKETLVKLFVKLQESEEQTILLLQMELGHENAPPKQVEESLEGIPLTLGEYPTMGKSEPGPKRRKK